MIRILVSVRTVVFRLTAWKSRPIRPWKGTKRTSMVIPVKQAQFRCSQRKYITSVVCKTDTTGAWLTTATSSKRFVSEEMMLIICPTVVFASEPRDRRIDCVCVRRRLEVRRWLLANQLISKLPSYLPFCTWVSYRLSSFGSLCEVRWPVWCDWQRWRWLSRGQCRLQRGWPPVDSYHRHQVAQGSAAHDRERWVDSAVRRTLERRRRWRRAQTRGRRSLPRPRQSWGLLSFSALASISFFKMKEKGFDVAVW